MRTTIIISPTPHHRHEKLYSSLLLWFCDMNRDLVGDTAIQWLHYIIISQFIWR
jgi:hypothetical protein